MTFGLALGVVQEDQQEHIASPMKSISPQKYEGASLPKDLKPETLHVPDRVIGEGLSQTATLRTKPMLTDERSRMNMKRMSITDDREEQPAEDVQKQNLFDIGKLVTQIQPSQRSGLSMNKVMTPRMAQQEEPPSSTAIDGAKSHLSQNHFHATKSDSDVRKSFMSSASIM